MYKLYLYNDKILIYNNNEHKLYNDNLIPIKIIKKNHIQIKQNTILLHIFVGQQCNFSCKYCNQLSTHNRTYKDNFNENNLILFVKNLIKFLNTKSDNLIDICFIGGEPLLYFKEIDFIIKKLKYNNKINYSIFTNGFLINDKLISWCYENNVKINISWDGDGNELRSYNMFNKELILNNINLFKFSSVITNKSISPKHIKNSAEIYFGKYYNDLIFRNIHMLTINNDISLKCSPTFEDMKSFGDDIISGEAPLFYRLKKFVNRHIVNLNLEDGFSGNMCDCHVQNTYTIDLMGNFLICPSFINEKLGNIFINTDRNEYKFDRYYNDVYKIRCVNCIFNILCTGHCPMTPTKYIEYNCKNYYNWYTGVFKYMIYLITGQKLQKWEKI